ncbi:MAG: hypothetical protein JST06_04870 [Bacteroidetes bacterium]|nr:hypothetical protein [Bacteroidota bacterium]
MSSARDIIQEWGLDPALHSKESILQALSLRIQELLARDPMAFLQLMYRLDIPEGQFESALDAPDAGSLIAGLIWNRQEQKSILRRQTPPRQEGDEDLAW